MQITVITVEQAKAQSKTSRVSSEQEKAVLDMLQNLTKDEGVKITLSDGENMSALKKYIEAAAAGEGIDVIVKPIKKKGFILIWRNS